MRRRTGLTLLLIAVAFPLMAASLVPNPLAGAHAFPNPWRIDKHANMSVTFNGMPASSVIKIFTVSAREVKQLMADSSGTAMWDRTNDSGQAVASGVYIYLIIDPQGDQTSGKLAIIK